MYHFMEPPPDEGSYDTNNSIDKTLNKPPHPTATCRRRRAALAPHCPMVLTFSA